MFDTRPQIDQPFDADGRRFRVSAITATRVIGTLAGVIGAPTSADQIITVERAAPDQPLNDADCSAASEYFNSHVARSA